MNLKIITAPNMTNCNIVLVTGGAGFIGSHTVELLLKENYKVRVLDNFSSGKVTNLPLNSNLEIITGDVRNDFDVSRAAQNVDYIIHLAAQTSVPKSIKDPKNSFTNNLAGLINILEITRDNSQIKKIIFASSAAIYGDNQNLPLNENEIINNEFLSPYALEKSVSENYLSLYSRLYNVNYSILRYFNVFGPRQDPNSPYSGVISKFISFFRNKESFKIFGDGTQSRDFIYVADVAKANLLALKKEENDIYNIATGTKTSLLDIVEIFKDFSQGDINLEFLSERKGDIKYSAANIEKAKKELNFMPEYSMAEIKQLLI